MTIAFIKSLNAMPASVPSKSADRGPVKVDVFDVAGRRVREMKVGAPVASTRAITFDGRDHRGHLLPSGLYFCRVQGNGATITRKLVIQR